MPEQKRAKERQAEQAGGQAAHELQREQAGGMAKAAGGAGAVVLDRYVRCLCYVRYVRYGRYVRYVR